VFLALTEAVKSHVSDIVVTFGRVSLFFYIIHIYVIHLVALVALEIAGRSWTEYIMTAEHGGAKPWPISASICMWSISSGSWWWWGCTL